MSASARAGFLFKNNPCECVRVCVFLKRDFCVGPGTKYKVKTVALHNSGMIFGSVKSALLI